MMKAPVRRNAKNLIALLLRRLELYVFF